MLYIQISPIYRDNTITMTTTMSRGLSGLISLLLSLHKKFINFYSTHYLINLN